MSNRGTKGSAHVIIAIIIVVAIVGALGYAFWKNMGHKSADTSGQNSSTAKQVSSQDILHTIDTALRGLPHRSGVEAAQGIYVQLDQPSVTIVLNEYPVDVVYNASSYAGTTNTPVGPVSESETGKAASEQALNKQKVTAILEENGLKLSHSNTEGAVTDDLYDSDKVVCQVTDSLGLASVRCVAADYVIRAKANIKDAYAAVLTKYQQGSIDLYSVPYYENQSKGTYGAIFSFKETVGGDFDAYMVKVSDKGWQYLASSTKGTQSIIEPSCSVMATPELRDLFKRTDCK